MKREDPISLATMIRSRYRLLGFDKGPKGKKSRGEASTIAGGDTNEEIDQFTLGLRDILPSPPQPQPQTQAQAQAQAPNCLDQILARLDHMKRSIDEHADHSKITYLSIASKTWIQLSSNFGHFGLKGEVVLA